MHQLIFLSAILFIPLSPSFHPLLPPAPLILQLPTFFFTFSASSHVALCLFSLACFTSRVSAHPSIIVPMSSQPSPSYRHSSWCQSLFLLFHRTMSGKRHSTVQPSMDTLRWFQCCFRSWLTRRWETTDRRLLWTWQHFMDDCRSVRKKIIGIRVLLLFIFSQWLD